MRLVAIGDIHGNYKELVELLSVLKDETDFDADTFIFMGDYVDGGPDTAKVIELLRTLAKRYPHWVFLKGNHEDMMIEALFQRSITYGGFGGYDQWWGQGGQSTFMSYAREAHPKATEYELKIMQPLKVIPPADLVWLEERPLYYETKNHIFVHGGLIPDKQPHEMQERDLLWIRSLFYNSDCDWGKRVIFGHSWHIRPLLHSNKIGIDTLSRFDKRDVGHLGAVILNDETPGRQEFVCANPSVRAEWNKMRVPD